MIVVDKLLTGFDAPSATYLYIDKQMQDHGLFQAICRVNRLDGDDKEYGYIVDYKDLFKSLEASIKDYTSEVFDGYEKDDVAGLLSDRLEKSRERLDNAMEAVKALCEPVELPRDTPAYLRFFCSKDTSDNEALKENEPKRLRARRRLGVWRGSLAGCDVGLARGAGRNYAGGRGRRCRAGSRSPARTNRRGAACKTSDPAGLYAKQYEVADDPDRYADAA